MNKKELAEKYFLCLHIIVIGRNVKEIAINDITLIFLNYIIFIFFS